MQTRCPHCQTKFRVSETQLEAAQGKVRCGKCQQVFNAREHINQDGDSDTPVTKKAKKTATPAPQVDWLQQEDKKDEFEHIDLGETGNTNTDTESAELSKAAIDAFLAENEATELDESDSESTSKNERLDTEIEPDTELPDTGTETENTFALEDSLIPGRFNEPSQDIEKEVVLPGIAPAYEDDSHLNAREEQGLDNLQDEIHRQLENPVNDDNTGTDGDAYDSALDYIEDVVEQPVKTSSVENIEISAPPAEETGNAVNWDNAVHLDPEVPASLRSSMQALEEKKQRPILITSLMASALFILIIGMTLQLVVFRSYDAATKWPQTRETLTGVCQYLPCVYGGRRDPRKIQLVSRDVRVHPVAKHALLISATVVNQAGYAQPYPRLAIKLSDLSGDVVAEREFAPKDYLKTSESQLKLLRPDVPTLINLEVLDPGSEAVNFEFRFL